MGARIDGIGEEIIRIAGVKELGGADPRDHPRPDRGRDVPRGRRPDPRRHRPDGVQPDHLHGDRREAPRTRARHRADRPDALRVIGSPDIKPQDITTSPYPGFPTDMQAQFMVLMTQAAGTSIITETIFDRRFSHVNELLRLGANIEVAGDKAVVRAKPALGRRGHGHRPAGLGLASSWPA